MLCSALRLLRGGRHACCSLLQRPHKGSRDQVRESIVRGLAMIRVFSMGLSLVALLVACRTVPPPTRAELLDKLQQCHDVLTKERPNGPSSSCTKLDLSALNGISRTDLVSVLGPPSFCLGLSEGAPPHGSDCPSRLDPKWSFHRMGETGPELSCVTDAGQHCEVVRWIAD